MITVRDACEFDIPRILEIADDAISPAWTHKSVKEGLDKDDTLLLVAVKENGHCKQRGRNVSAAGGTVTGFAIFRQVGGDGELLQIAVDASERRSGTGSLLISAVLEHASAGSLASVFLEVRAGNAAAIGLYKKHGFKELRIRKKYYNGPDEDAVVMVRVL